MNMKHIRYLVISDIHGCYDEFMELLELTNYNPKHDQLILLGDYVDRGKDSKRVLDKVMELVKNGAIAIRGNHDDWFIKFISSPQFQSNSALINEYLSKGVGGLHTINSYIDFDVTKTSMEQIAEKIKNNCKHHIQFLSQLPYYYETDDYIFVHAGINSTIHDWRNDLIGMSWIRWDFINKPTNLKKQVVFGHTTCKVIHNSNNIWIDKDKIGIDGACCFGGQLNCLEITDSELNQFHVKRNLYRSV